MSTYYPKIHGQWSYKRRLRQSSKQPCQTTPLLDSAAARLVKSFKNETEMWHIVTCVLVVSPWQFFWQLFWWAPWLPVAVVGPPSSASLGASPVGARVGPAPRVMPVRRGLGDEGRHHQSKDHQQSTEHERRTWKYRTEIINIRSN